MNNVSGYSPCPIYGQILSVKSQMLFYGSFLLYAPGVIEISVLFMICFYQTNQVYRWFIFTMRKLDQLLNMLTIMRFVPSSLCTFFGVYNNNIQKNRASCRLAHSRSPIKQHNYIISQGDSETCG